MSNQTAPHLTIDTATAAVLAAISHVAPDVEAELPNLDPDEDFFDEFELDSMDHANVISELSKATGVAVPERRYSTVRSVASLAAFLVEASQA